MTATCGNLQACFSKGCHTGLWGMFW